MRTAKILIRLGGCPGWSQSSLGAHAILLVLSWGGSNLFEFWNTHILPNFFSYFNWNMSRCTTKPTKLRVPSKDADQPGHLPSLIRVFTVHMKKHWALNYIMSAQWRLWSDWADAQADPSLCWGHIVLVLSWGGSYFSSNTCFSKS